MNLISSTSLLRIRYSGRRFPTRSSPDAPSVVPGFVAAVPAPSSATLSRCSWAVTTTPSPPCEIQQANKNTVIAIWRFICIASPLFVRRISIKLARSYLRGRFVARHEKCCLPKWSIRNVVLFWPAEARLIRKLCRKRRWSELKPERVQLCRNSTLSTLAMSTKVDLWDVRFPIINDLDLYSGAVWDLLSATYSLTSYSICTLRCTRFRPRFPHCLHIRMLRCHRNPYRKSHRLGAQWFEK